MIHTADAQSYVNPDWAPQHRAALDPMRVALDAAGVAHYITDTGVALVIVVPLPGAEMHSAWVASPLCNDELAGSPVWSITRMSEEGEPVTSPVAGLDPWAVYPHETLPSALVAVVLAEMSA